VIGSLIALRQDNLKRRLAYSTVVHLSYIVLGAALVAPFGMVGSVMHMVNHGLAKITLFFCAGAIYATTHRENISELAGSAGRCRGPSARSPSARSRCRDARPERLRRQVLPGRGAIQAGDMVALGIMLGASLLTASYLLPIVRIAFFPGRGRTDDARLGQRAEAPAAMLVPLLVTAVLVVVFGVCPFVIGVQYDLAADVAARVFGGAP
jgi:multicomponent Na+:H+ antiporter subunit D